MLPRHGLKQIITTSERERETNQPTNLLKEGLCSEEMRTQVVLVESSLNTLCKNPQTKKMFRLPIVKLQQPTTSTTTTTHKKQKF